MGVSEEQGEDYEVCQNCYGETEQQKRYMLPLPFAEMVKTGPEVGVVYHKIGFSSFFT